MKTTLSRIGLAAAVAATMGVAPAAMGASAAPPTSAVAAKPAATSVPVTGVLDGTAFTGTLSNLTASVVDGVLQISGTITGTGLPAGGTTFTAPVQDLTANQSCTILTLDLGPLDLDLLGLVVELSPISLDVTAVPGAGNLLGNLLCAVAGLFDGPGGLLDGIARLLNRLLTGLGL